MLSYGFRHGLGYTDATWELEEDLKDDQVASLFAIALYQCTQRHFLVYHMLFSHSFNMTQQCGC